MTTLVDFYAQQYSPQTALPGTPAVGVTLFNTELVSTDPGISLSDTFDGASIDTNQWTTGGTVPPTTSGAGSLLVNPGAAASASSIINSTPTFRPSGYELLFFFFQVEAGTLATGNHRVLGGLYTRPGSFTALTPVQDGYVLELDTLAALRFSVYAGGVRVSSTVLSSTINDGNPHTGVLHYRPGIAAIAIDQSYTYLATSFLNPQVQILPVGAHSINAVGGASLSPTLSMSAVAFVDYSRPAQATCDGTYAWRRQTVGPRGDAVISLMDGNKASYSASVSGLVGVAGDILIINGSATKTIRVTRMSFGGTATAAADMDVTVVKRSTANTAGTAVAATPHDAANAAATAVVNSFTAAPTPGAAVGTPIRSAKSFIATATAAPFIQNWDFGNGPKQGIVLRGVAQGLAINVSATQIGALYDLDLEWTEE
jgi:hypothetical protein